MTRPTFICKLLLVCGVLSCSVMSNSLRPHELQPARILLPWNFPGKSTRVGFHFLLQGIFPTQGSNPGLPHCRQTLYHLSHQRLAKEFQKNVYCFIEYAKTFDCLDHNKPWKVLKESGNIKSFYISPEKPVCWSRSISWNQKWNNRLVQNWENNTSRLYVVTLLIQHICRVHCAKCETG